MVPFNNYKHVFTPIKVGQVTLKSRIEFSPMVCDLTTSGGEATQGYIDFVEKQAMSGVGLITLGATPVDLETGTDYAAELDVTTDDKVHHLVMLSEAAHRHGAKLSIELVHAGRGADPRLITKPYALAPSNFTIPGQVKYIKEMDEHDIERVVDCYVDCSVRLQKCGFDGVMIHGAHGNLLAQFLSPLTNHRSDMYGGSFENRARFPLRVLKAVREAVGKKFMLELRISGDEIVPGGMRIDEVIEFIKLAQEHIDLVNISAGLVVDWRAQFYCMPPYYRPKGANVPYARAVKQCPDIHIPVSVVGGIVSAEQADQIIDEGSADMCAVARALLSDPDMLNKSYRGKAEEARPCLRCWGCGGTFGGHITCAVNPQLARNPFYSEVTEARMKKRCIVVGGGVSGCQAARTLMQRGHEVILLEKDGQLGGLLNDINKLDFKDDMLRYTEWLQRDTLACGAEIHLNTEATPETVMALSPDVIVVAVGGRPARPPVPGLNGANVFNVLDVDSGRKKVSGRVVVCGGGLSGCESGLQLAMEGCEVTIVDQIPVDGFASGVHRMTRNMLMYLLEENKVKLIGDHIVRAIGEKSVAIEGRDWRYAELEADYVVDALGMVSNCDLAERFRTLIPDVYVVGDAGEVKNIKHANHSAYDICRNI